MIRKLIGRMELLKTGRSRLILVILIWLLAGCWQEAFDYSYRISYRNETTDTILLILGKDNDDYYIDSLPILPMRDTFIEGNGTDGVYNGENPAEIIFSSGYRPLEEQVRVYRHDSLKVTWDGPARYMPDSIHHFYNYNSWDSWLLDEKNKYCANGIIMFTITEDDFVKN